MTSITAYSPEDYEVFIGLDVDKSSFSFAAKDHGIMNQTKKIPSQPDNLVQYIRKTYPGKKVICAYEAGPTGFNLYDHMNQEEIPCLVVSPSSVPKASSDRVKTNRIDSEKIAHYLRSGELKAVRVPVGEYRELRHLVRIRENYALGRRIARQRIKALLLLEHLHEDIDISSSWSKNDIEKLKRISCTLAVRQRLDMIIMDLEYVRSKLAVVNKGLRSFCKQYPDLYRFMEYLQSVPGIGFITAATILGNIGDPRNLRNPGEIAAFAGLVPKERSTGDTIRRSSITRLGDRVLRALLIEASWFAIKKDKALQQFFCRIRQRHHPYVGARKAIVAVARKLTHIVYRVLTEERMYVRCEDLYTRDTVSRDASIKK